MAATPMLAFTILCRNDLIGSNAFCPLIRGGDGVLASEMPISGSIETLVDR